MTEWEAGRELDALVHENVMGFPHECSLSGDGTIDSPMVLEPRGAAWRRRSPSDGFWERWSPSGAEVVVNDLHVPPYSTDIAAAWLVVEKLVEIAKSRNLWGPSLLISAPLSASPQWSVRLKNDLHGGMAEPHTDDTIWMGVGPTAPLAICRAALKAVGV